MKSVIPLFRLVLSSGLVAVRVVTNTLHRSQPGASGWRSQRMTLQAAEGDERAVQPGIGYCVVRSVPALGIAMISRSPEDAVRPGYS